MTILQCWPLEAAESALTAFSTCLAFSLPNAGMNLFKFTPAMRPVDLDLPWPPRLLRDHRLAEKCLRGLDAAIFSQTFVFEQPEI